jgi:hypothetical protein
MRAFEQQLKDKYGIKDVSWTRVSRGNDPPDFYLQWLVSKSAVEVTSMRIFRETAIDDGFVLEETYENSHREFVKELSRIAEEGGYLHGTYAIISEHPLSA